MLPLSNLSLTLLLFYWQIKLKLYLWCDSNNVFLKTSQIAKEHGGIMRFIQVSCLGASLSSPSRMLRAKAAAEEAIFREFPEVNIFSLSFPLVYWHPCINKILFWKACQSSCFVSSIYFKGIISSRFISLCSAFSQSLCI